jgi:peroxin-3
LSNVAAAPREDPIAIQIREEQLEEERSEDERVYLSYSWWILHEGWRGVSQRVREAVEEVFGS